MNDRIVERDFQWTDNTGLVSGGSLGAWGPAVRLLTLTLPEMERAG